MNLIEKRQNDLARLLNNKRNAAAAIRILFNGGHKMNDRIKANQETFRKLLTPDTERKCLDGSGMDNFILTAEMIPGVAENLAQWWDENSDYDDIELTPEFAEEYIDETYPEI